MNKLTMKSKILAIAFLTLAACSPKQEKGVERDFGETFNGVSAVNFHAHDTSMGACERREQLVAQRESNPAGSDAFSILSSFNFAPAANGINFSAGVTTGESPLFMHILSSDKIKPLMESPDPVFLDVAKVLLKIGTCDLADAAAWGPGCLTTWGQTAGALGCKLPEAANSPQCQAIWSRVLVKKEIGKCAPGAPNEGEAECTTANAKFAALNQLAGANMLFLGKNAFLKQRFPGMFGGTENANESLFLGLIAKVRGFHQLGSEAAGEILTEKLPLFPADRAWSSFLRDMEISTGAWVRGVGPDSSLDNRLCAFVLAQRSFAQMLALNGFVRPELSPEGNAIELSAQRNSLGAVPVAGGFLGASADGTMLPTILTPADLSGYDPEAKLIVGAKRLPKWNSAPELNIEGLAERLDRMQAVELFYEATSPIAAWLPAGQPNLLGDLEDPANSAILPYEAHALAFGQLTVDLKNLQKMNIKKITAEGDLVNSPEDRALGFVLLRTYNEQTYQGVMDLRDLARLAKIVVRMEDALGKILKADPAQLAMKNPFYATPGLRPKLEGLFASLRQMKLPLTSVMYRMAGTERGCASQVGINIKPRDLLAPGENPVRQVPMGRCQEQHVREYTEAREMLTRSLFQETASR